MNPRNLFHKLWYFIWFVALPLSIAWTLVGILDKMRMVDEFEPWYVLLLFALLVVGIYSIRDKLPFWKDRDENSAFNRGVRINHGRAIIKRIRKIIKKHDAKINSQGKKKIIAAMEQLESEIENSNHKEIPAAIKTLEECAAKHLAFAKKSAGREYFESIGIAVIIAIGLRLFAVEAFKIPSESMVPTLMVGDHIFVSKYRYGISLPFKNKQLVQFATPAYGDVIVFVKPTKLEQGDLSGGHSDMEGQDFIKRIIGLPGDKIEVKNSVVYVNDKPIPRCKIGKSTFRSREDQSGEWRDHESELWIEQHGDHLYTVVEEYLIDDEPPKRVPQGQVFVMGDNRDRSSDSRYWGTVPIDNIKGRAMVIWWSNKRPHGFQWNRIGNVIMGKPNLTPEQQAALEKCEFMPKD